MGGAGGGARHAMDADGGREPGDAVLARQQAFTLQPKDHISIIGNTLAERMQYDGWLETMLQARFPKHELVVRNLGFSGDEVSTRPRSKNFGTPDEWLSGLAQPIGGYEDNRLAGTNTKADVVFAFFGYNESFAGQAGLDAFKKELTAWIAHTLAQKYNGKSAPRVVLFSPLAHEDLGNPDLPDGKENNQRLALYTKAMADAARAGNITFVDLYTPSARLYAENKAPLTIQGIHLNPEGNRQIAQVIDRDALRRHAEAPGDPADEIAPGGRRQGSALVSALPRDRRLLDLRRPRVPHLRSREPTKRRREADGRRRQRRRPAQQLRRAAARAADPRPDDQQPRQAHLGSRRRRRSDRRRLEHAAVRRRQDQHAERVSLQERRRDHQGDDDRPGTQGRALRVRERVSRAGQAGSDGVRHQGTAVGGGLEKLSPLAAEDADGRQAAHPRGHQWRRQGRQVHGLRRRSPESDRLRVLERRRARRRSSQTSSS